MAHVLDKLYKCNEIGSLSHSVMWNLHTPGSERFLRTVNRIHRTVDDTDKTG